MKVRFSDGAIRVRVARGQFDDLRAGSVLRVGLPLTPRGCAVTVRCAESFSADSTADGLAIAFPAEDMDALAGRLPARDGPAWTAQLGGRDVEVSLEVDVRSRPAPAPPR